jgi:2-polyprenyl-6-methoxyphenol hydroxylase-like FAD-dependent oxidoreductase
MRGGAIVVGAGIGGLTAALGLRRCGWPAFEVAILPAFRPFFRKGSRPRTVFEHVISVGIRPDARRDRVLTAG